MDGGLVIVTGASTGIGRATALALAARGHDVIAGVRKDVDAEAWRDVPRVTAHRLDVTREEDLRSTAALVDARGGRLRALVNNAGHNYNAPFEHTDEPTARGLVDVNLFGLARLTQTLVPALRRDAAARPRDTAKIVNVSSIGGLFGLPWQSFYHASKFAVIGLTESLRHELWAQRVRATVVLPGGIRTELMPETELVATDEGPAPRARSARARAAAGRDVVRGRDQRSLAKRRSSSS